MPRARSSCPEPGCPQLQPCPVHARKPWQHTEPSARRRGYGSLHEAMRRIVLVEEPVCRICGINPSTRADHIVPKYKGGGDDRMNYQGVCEPCHEAKSAREGAEARHAVAS